MAKTPTKAEKYAAVLEEALYMACKLHEAVFSTASNPVNAEEDYERFLRQAANQLGIDEKELEELRKAEE